MPQGLAGLGDLLWTAATDDPLARAMATRGAAVLPTMSWTASRAVPAVYQALGGPEPTPGSTLEQEAARYAENLGAAIGPSLLAGGAGLIPAIAGSLTGTTGSELARVSRLSPRTQMIADVLGNIAGGGVGGVAGRGATAFTRAATRGGIGRAAGEEIMRTAGPESAATLGPRIAAGMETPVGLPGAPRSVAAVTGDPALARLEDAIRATPEGEPLRALQGQRGKMIADELEKLTPKLTPDAGTRGDSIRTNLNMQERVLNQRSDQLYEAAREARGPGALPTGDLLTDVAKVADKFYGPGNPAPAEFRNIARQIVEQGRTVTGRWLDGMDRQIGDTARAARRSGNNTLAAALGEVRDALGGVAPSPAYDVAKAWRRSVGRVMGRDEAGANAADVITRTDQFGQPTMSVERVAARAVQDPASVKQILNAGDLAIEAARQSGSPTAVRTMEQLAERQKMLLREQFMTNAARKARGLGEGAVVEPGGDVTAFANWKPGQWQRFWQDNARVADQIFTPAQKETFEQVSAMMGEDLALETRAAQGGSQTAQRLAFAAPSGNPMLAQIVRDWTNGRVNPNSWIGRSMAKTIQMVPHAGARIMGGAIGHYLLPGGGEIVGAMLPEHAFFGSASARNAAYREIVARALADPEQAQLLMGRLSDEAVQRAIRDPNSKFSNTLRSIYTLGTRAGARIGTQTWAEQYEPTPQAEQARQSPPQYVDVPTY